MAKRYALNKSKYLNDSEHDRLCEIINSFRTSDLRNCLLIELALCTGARASELLMTKKADIDEFDRTLFINGIKGSNDREIPLKDSLFERLQQHSSASSGELIFPISYNRLRQIWQHYRPCHKKFHCLRHTFAIRLYQKTRDIRLVQVALGHRNITNTMIYADYVYTKQELRKLLI